MTHRTFSYLAVASLISITPAFAALKVGDQAPLFQTRATLGGNEFSFSLAEALKDGPVVLYFYPAAFTPGCTVEAHDFAAAVDQYKALGAKVVGVSHDDIAKLNRFSVSDCQGKFAVASDPDQHIMTAYDAIMPAKPEYANRTSYVISPDGHILYTYTDLKPGQHVANTLAALKQWKSQPSK